MLFIGVVVASFSVSAQNKYVGVKMCSMCHKSEKQGKQFDIWQKTKHAEAYKVLTTAKANEIAKSKGIAKPAAEATECLDCHAKARDAKEASYDVKDGVQCETCHGAGSAYKNMAVMKDKAKAIAAGMTDFKDHATIEKLCKTCHNEKSPTYKEFKFDEMWGKIKHPVPKG
ncbi:MAG: cytochrome C554 [Ignavibacteriales bacterium]|nr:cytochrome C554 [Ignavibacteriales bacterium]